MNNYAPPKVAVHPCQAHDADPKQLNHSQNQAKAQRPLLSTEERIVPTQMETKTHGKKKERKKEEQTPN
jgi:hypothetical protein